MQTFPCDKEIIISRFRKIMIQQTQTRRSKGVFYTFQSCIYR